MKRYDRMDIFRDDNITDEVRYGSLFPVRLRTKYINDYAGENESDADKLDNITNAAPGSTCLSDHGKHQQPEFIAAEYRQKHAA